MSYQAEISRVNPSCFLFLIDQSGSMSDTFGTGEIRKTKSESLADVLNRLLANLIIKCSKGDEIRDYFHLNIIGYGSTVEKLFISSLSNQDVVPISAIANNPARIEERIKKIDDGAGGLIDTTIKFPVWLDPVSSGGTPMCKGLQYAKSIIEKWINDNPNCFPPIVINITDGESTDGNPTFIAQEIKNIQSTDGNVLFFNIHISSLKAMAIEFPDNPTLLPDNFAKMLFEMSSVLPPHIQNAAKQEGYNVSDNSRGFTFNADLVALIRFLDIGTRPSNLR